MLHKTRGIVLRTVKYGETSVIVTILTERFGVQAYLVNGVRTERKTGSARAALLQPSSILDLVVYHHGSRNLERISEIRAGYLYRTLYDDPVKNAVALYLVELLLRSLKQPEENSPLYLFAENSLRMLDADNSAAANLPLYFTLRLGEMLGFRFSGKFTPAAAFLDLMEGVFVAAPPHHPWFLDPENSRITDLLLSCNRMETIGRIPVTAERRRQLLQAYLEFFRFHQPDFAGLKSPAILREILE